MFLNGAKIWKKTWAKVKGNYASFNFIKVNFRYKLMLTVL